MKSWQEALKILLVHINLPVADLAQHTGTSPSSIRKFIQGTNNSSTKVLQTWVEACERYEPGSWKTFHLICAGHIKGKPEPEPVELKGKKSRKEIEEYVGNLDLEELSEHLSAIAKYMHRYRKESEIYYQPKEISFIESSEVDLEEEQMCLNLNQNPPES